MDRFVIFLLYIFSCQIQDQLKAQKVTGLVLIGTISIVENMMVVTKKKNIFLQKLKHRVLLFELQKSQQVNFYILTHNMTDIQSSFYPQMESNQNYNFCPKNDGEKWSRKNIFEIPSCGKLFCNNSLFRAKTQKLVVLVTKNI